MKSLYMVLAAALLLPSASAQNFQGNWKAIVEEYGKPVQYVVHISQAEGATTATADIPGQFLFGTPLDAVSVENSTLRMRAGQVSYVGSISADSQHIEGTWAIGGDEQPVIWRRISPGSADPVASVAKQLESLVYLPDEEWKLHTGDVAHGESVELDDSSWQLVRPGSFAPPEAEWYRRWIEIPKTLNGYDLTNSKIWFDFQYDANGPITAIIYFNGRRVAIGDSLEPMVLFERAHPGDKVLVAVKLLRSVDKKHFLGVPLRVEFPSTRPNPSTLFAEMGAVSILAPHTSDPEKTRRELEETAAAVDLGALNNSDQTAFDASLKQAQNLLDPLKPELQQTSLRMSGNSHIDAAWLWPWTETVDVVRRTFGTALQLMEEYPQFTYTQSAAAYSEWVCRKYPGMHEQIVKRVKEGRWEMVGGMWVEPDLNMPDGESLVRQLLVGKRYFKEKFGTDVRIGWNPDSFGYNWQLPQIYKKSGVDYFVTQKMAWNDTNQLPLKIFWWQSPDGSRVLTYFPHDYGNDIEPLRMARDIAAAQALNPGSPEMMHLFGVGDHGGGPTRAMLDEGMRWVRSDVVYPKTTFGIAQGFFSDIEGKADSDHAPVWNYKTLADGNTKLPQPAAGKFSLPVWNDELYFEYHRGVFTTQAKHKKNMRDSEEQMLNAEKFSSLAWLLGGQYPGTELTEEWKKVLFNQFHDLAAGSGIGEIYKDSQRDYDSVRLLTDHVSAQAWHTIDTEINTRGPAGSVPFIVINPLAWERTDVVPVEIQMPERALGTISIVNSKGEPQPFQVLSSDPTLNTYQVLVEANKVPSLGYRMLYAIPGTAAGKSDLQVRGLTLENSWLKMTVDAKNGCITSLYNKRSQFESIAANGCGNELIAFKDTPKDYDAWNIDSDFEDQFTKLDMVDSVNVVEQGPLRATVRVVRTWQGSKFVQDLSMYANLDRVDVHNEIDWHANHILLKAAFPLAASSDKATFEIPYGTIERPTTRKNRVQKAKFEVPALRWADLGNGNEGFSLINESKYGYDAKGNLLRLSLLRSPTWPDPEADRGHHSFSYSLYPHAGDWRQALTVRRGYDFNYKLSGEQVQSHAGSLPAEHSFVKVQQDHVVLTAVKKAEDVNALLLRFYEWSGKSGDVELSVPPGAISAQLTNLMEEPEGSPLPITAGNHITVPVHAYEIVSVRVTYPAKP